MARQGRERTAAPGEATIVHDVVSEAAVVGAGMADPSERRKLLAALQPDAFAEPKHRAIWAALGEVDRRRLDFDLATLQKLGPDVDPGYARQIAEDRPSVPANLAFHVEQVLWDGARINAARGPISSLLDALRDPTADPERVKALARQVAGAFDGYQSRRYLRDPDELRRGMTSEVRLRAAGRQSYSYGIERLDYYEKADSEGKALRRMVPGAAPGQVTVVTGVSGSGKALDCHTPIATVQGWKSMGTLRPGDQVFDETGAPCKVLRCSEVMNGRDCYEVVFSDGARIVADAEHLWKTMTAAERRAAVHRTDVFRAKRRAKRGYKTERPWISKKLLDARRGSISVDGGVRSTKEIAETARESFSRRNATNHSVLVAKPLQLPTRELPIDPYLLGVWLGDGTSLAGQYTKHDAFIARRIRRRGYEVRKSKSASGRWSIIGLLVVLRKVGLLGAKHIPIEYLRSSIDQRWELLKGLMDTDGTCSPRGQCSFTTTTRALADGFEELLFSLGIKSRKIEGIARLYEREIGPVWDFAFATEREVFSLPRKKKLLAEKRRTVVNERRYIIAVKKVLSRPVRCIAVGSKSKLFLAGRQMIPTHNSTLTARIALGLARNRRKVLYGAWEQSSAMTLELLACMSCAFSRQRLQDGQLTEEELVMLDSRAASISRYVRFFDIPFNRGKGEKRTNDQNLDLIQGYLSDSGCEVFIADLWKRCLRYTDPDDEEQALVRQQAMCEELKVHAILVQQQRLKDVEQRQDKRPTREGIKGSSAWVEVADTILGVHRPALWKSLDDTVFEIDVLKQRYGKWPQAIEFDWDGDAGLISGGRTVAYEARTEGGGNGGGQQGIQDYFKTHPGPRRK